MVSPKVVGFVRPKGKDLISTVRFATIGDQHTRTSSDQQLRDVKHIMKTTKEILASLHRSEVREAFMLEEEKEEAEEEEREPNLIERREDNYPGGFREDFLVLNREESSGITKILGRCDEQQEAPLNNETREESSRLTKILGVRGQQEASLMEKAVTESSSHITNILEGRENDDEYEEVLVDMDTTNARDERSCSKTEETKTEQTHVDVPTAQTIHMAKGDKRSSLQPEPGKLERIRFEKSEARDINVAAMEEPSFIQVIAHKEGDEMIKELESFLEIKDLRQSFVDLYEDFHMGREKNGRNKKEVLSSFPDGENTGHSTRLSTLSGTHAGCNKHRCIHLEGLCFSNGNTSYPREVFTKETNNSESIARQRTCHVDVDATDHYQEDVATFTIKELARDSANCASHLQCKQSKEADLQYEYVGPKTTFFYSEKAAKSELQNNQLDPQTREEKKEDYSNPSPISGPTTPPNLVRSLTPITWDNKEPENIFPHRENAPMGGSIRKILPISVPNLLDAMDDESTTHEMSKQKEEILAMLRKKKSLGGGGSNRTSSMMLSKGVKNRNTAAPEKGRVPLRSRLLKMIHPGRRRKKKSVRFTI